MFQNLARAILIVALFSIGSAATSTTWKNLLHEAETLADAGNLDSAQVIFQQALESAETQYTRSDSTVDILFYKEGIPQRYYFLSYSDASQLYEEFLATAEKLFGQDHAQVATVLLRLAESYRVLGRYYDAEPLLTRALKIRESLYGRKHAQVAEVLDRLGVIYSYYADYEKAATFCDSALMMRERVHGIDHPEVAWSCLNLANALIKLKIFDVARQLCEKATAIVEREFGTDGLEMADCLEMTGLVDYSGGDKESAESLFLKSLEIRRRHVGSNHPLVATSLFRLANTYRYQFLDKNPEAESLFVEALTIREDVFGPEHPEVAWVLYYFGMFHHYNDIDYAKAESLYTRSLNIRENVLGENHSDVAMVLYWLGSLYCYDLAEYGKAEVYYKRVLSIREKVLAENHVDISYVLFDLSGCYESQGRFAEALPIREKALKIDSTIYGPESIDAMYALKNLGVVCRRLGRYVDAESYLKRALVGMEKLLGPEHTDLADVLNALALTYDVQGRYTEAVRLYQRSLDIYRKVYGEDAPQTAYALTNLGGLYWSQGDFAQAASCHEKAVKLFVQGHGPRHRQVAIGLLNLGLSYDSQGRYMEADSVLSLSIEIGEETLGPQHPALAHACNNLSNVYTDMGRYTEAEPIQERAVNILETALGPEHPEVAKFRRDLGRLYAYAGKPDSSLESYDRFLDWSQRFVENVFPSSSEDQKLRWIDTYPLIDHTLTSLALGNPGERSLSLALEMVLKSKAIVLDAVMGERQAAYCHYDEEVVTNLKKHTGLCTEIANIAMAGGSFADSLQILYKLKNSLEIELSSHCSEFSDALAARRFEIPDVSSSLPKDAVLWEYLRYDPVDFSHYVLGDDKIGQPRYMAYSLDNNGNISAVDLAAVTTIDSLITGARDLIYKAQGQIYSPAAVSSEERLTEVTSQLYDILFAPLAAASGGNTDIYISPDGMLNLLPFEILPTPDGSYIIENYRISYLSSGRDLLKHKGDLESDGEMYVFADPDFDATSAEPFAQHDESALTASLASEVYGPSMRGIVDCLKNNFSRLGHSRVEAESVAERLKMSNVAKVNEFYDIQAMEDVLKSITDAPKVLHLATHGFFCESNKASTTLKDNPLLRSGLALAGANRTISGERDDDGEDGILTALEVSGLNLVGTDLAVLSACESGVGDFVNGEGLFGLRRAFQHAGAETVVMSLWAVPDRETSQLMDGFYRRWLSGLTKRDALRESAIELLNDSRNKRGCGHPLLWGGFILAGNPN